jgi:hypothetical protein
MAGHGRGVGPVTYEVISRGASDNLSARHSTKPRNFRSSRSKKSRRYSRYKKSSHSRKSRR